ncbi:MAG: ABC transporter ATP-binding protein, partial [Alphaproteobacteria bacterium]|nr:ABC transporter ATP-binding protein [Alphaproteobacteria bacterium]
MAESDSPAGVLSIEDLSAGYGKAAVISEIDLSLQPGEFFGLIGLNGAGKTTLIKTILGLRRALAGGIHIMGRPYDSGEARRALAYLPENFQPPWFLTGIEFLRFSLKLHNQKKADADLRESAQRLALDPAVLDRRVQTYSKGMRQKLGLLGTVLVECPLLILDEPMSGLDPRARTLVKELLLAKKRKGCAVFLS